MRRVDVLGIGLGFFLAGGLVYGVLLGVGVESQKAGIWAQAVLVGGLILWLCSYIFRVLTHDMTYHQQIKDYEEALIQKRWDSLTPAERERLQAEVEAERSAQTPQG
ncbi:MAG: DUF3007 family protein [Cyanobacteriota bacterium]|nr:DUF3007 family protein [Cyanobacteriota bacterium]